MGKEINREIFKINNNVRSTNDVRMELNISLLKLNNVVKNIEFEIINDFVDSNIQNFQYDSMLLFSVMIRNIAENEIFNTEIFNKYFPKFKINEFLRPE